MRTHVMAALLAASSVATSCRSGQQDASANGSAAGTTTAVRSDVTVTLDRATYAAGATVTMTVRNQSRDTLGYNQCSSRAVERQEGSVWVGVPEPARMCTMELRLLNPNETQTATTDLPATLAPGTYQLVLTLGRQSTTGGSVRAVSLTFRVS